MEAGRCWFGEGAAEERVVAAGLERTDDRCGSSLSRGCGASDDASLPMTTKTARANGLDGGMNARPPNHRVVVQRGGDGGEQGTTPAADGLRSMALLLRRRPSSTVLSRSPFGCWYCCCWLVNGFMCMGQGPLAWCHRADHCRGALEVCCADGVAQYTVHRSRVSQSWRLWGTYWDAGVARFSDVGEGMVPSMT